MNVTGGPSTGPSMAGTPVIVIGGGKMGCGITVMLLENGHPVTVLEADAERAGQVKVSIDDYLEARGSRDRSERPSYAVLPFDRFTSTAPLVVETIPESVALKKEILPRAEQLVAPGGFLCSNTSSLSITDLATAVARPARFIGLHFFQPVPDTRLMEIVVGEKTDHATVGDAHAWVDSLGRNGIEVRDSPGFATSRLGLAIGLEAMRMVEEGVASAEDIDTGMRLGYQHAIGPLRMTDMVGLDTRLAIATHLAETLGPRFEPPNILREMVARGELGQKSGRGFFEWT